MGNQMWKLIPLYIIVLTLAYCSEKKSSLRIDREGRVGYKYKDKFFYFIMSVFLAFFVGLRVSGNDTGTYRGIYENIIRGGASGFLSIDWTVLSHAPGFQFVEVLLKTIGATTQDFIMVFSLFTVFVYLWFLHKYTCDIWLTIYYFLTMGIYTFCMAAIKQTTAVALLLIATDRAIERKYGSFLIWVLIAELFHPYSFIYLVIPLLFFAPWTGRTYLLVYGTIGVAFSLSYFMSGILSMTDLLGYGGYTEQDLFGDGVNIFRVFVVWIPVLLSYLGRRRFKNIDDRKYNLFVNLSMVNALVMFIGLFGTANYFARLANYFLIFQALSLPWLLRMFKGMDRKLIVMVSIVCYAGYHYYGSVIAQGAFDLQYRFMTFGDYLAQLF